MRSRFQRGGRAAGRDYLVGGRVCVSVLLWFFARCFNFRVEIWGRLWGRVGAEWFERYGWIVVGAESWIGEQKTLRIRMQD